jgi:hypothetical protein
MAQPAPTHCSMRRIARPAVSWLRAGLAVLVLCAFVPRLAAQTRPSQYDVEGAYLLNFGKFTQLTAASQALRRATFDICILGRDPIGNTIDKLAGDETIDRRKVRIVRDINAAQARTCAIVFISTRDDDRIREALNVLADSDVLTVGDSPDFLNDGGMIQFVLQNDHVRFSVNLEAVRKTHLVLSSQLLRVALYVKGQPQPEVAP